MKHYTLLVFAVLLAACGAQKYTANNFDQITADHEIIAVLPVEMIFTGKHPKDLGMKEIAEIEEAESKAFQISLQNALLGKASDKRIYFQEVDKTNQLLEEHDVTLRHSWEMEGDNLAGLLGVDAVVKMRVEKERYMSNLASFGVDMAQRVVDKISKPSFWLPHDLDRTNEISTKATLVNGKDGKVLWNMAVVRDADWNNPPKEIINGITRKYARNFPYD